jgi:hypothetical protein
MTDITTIHLMRKGISVPKGMIKKCFNHVWGSSLECVLPAGRGGGGGAEFQSYSNEQW